MLKTIVLGAAALLLLAIVVVLVIAAGQPDEFRVERRLRIQASPDKLQGLIADLHQFNRWSPYAKRDPAMAILYRGPASGPGAAFDFKGSRDVGTGSVDVVSAAPRQIGLRLRMTEPMAADHAIIFGLAPQGEATEVSWAMEGHRPFIGKVMGVIVNMDRMIGQDFETGLADLKILAEQP